MFQTRCIYTGWRGVITTDVVSGSIAEDPGLFKEDQ